MSIYITTPISCSVHRKAENPVFGEGVVTVSIYDEAGGAFVKLRANDYDQADGEMSMDYEQLAVIAQVAKEMIAQHDKLAKERGDE